MPGIVQSRYDIMILLFSHSPSVISNQGTRKSLLLWDKEQSLVKQAFAL